MIIIGILLFLCISSLLIPFFAKYGIVTEEVIPFYFYEQILLRNETYLNSLFGVFICSLISTIYLACSNKRINLYINQFLAKKMNQENEICAQSYSLEFFILSSTIFSTALFLLFFNNTAFEWTTSGEIPVILRDLDPNFLINDFYTNASSASPKLIFAKFVNFFQIFGLDWYSALYILKSVSVILTPPLLFLTYVKIYTKWMPNNLEKSFANIILISIFIGTLGLFGLPQFLDRMAPFGWSAIQFFYAVDSMRISFLVGLIYLILKFSKTNRVFLQISLLCISTLMHPTIGIINFVFSLVFSLPLGINRKNFFILFFESIIGILLPIALLSAYFDSDNILSAKDFYYYYVETRLPLHYKISSIIDIFSFVWVVLLMLPIIISNYLKNKNLKILSWLVFLSFISAVFLQFIFTEIYPIKAIMKIGPSRYTAYLSIIFSLLMIIILSHLLSDKIIFENLKKNFLFNLFLISINFLNRVLSKAYSFGQIKKPKYLYLFVICILSSLYFFTINDPLQEGSEEEEIISWITNNTKKDSVFMTKNFDPSLIRVFASRSIYADWMLPFTEKDMLKFSKRYEYYLKIKNTETQKIFCQDKESFFDYLILPNEGYARHSIFKNKKWAVLKAEELECKKSMNELPLQKTHVIKKKSFQEPIRKKFDIIVPFGQSNASGRGRMYIGEKFLIENLSKIKTFLFGLENKNLMYQKCTDDDSKIQPDLDCGFFAELHAPASDIYKYGTRSAWVNFSKVLDDQNQNKILLVNSAVGGTDLKDLMKGSRKLINTSHFRFESMIWGIEDALKLKGAENIDSISFIWIHGENDSARLAEQVNQGKDINDSFAEYFKDLNILLKSIKKEVNFKKINFYTVRIGTVEKPELKFNSDIIQNDLGYWQIEFACLNPSIIKPISLTPISFSKENKLLKNDGIHYSREALDILGGDIAKNYQEYKKNNAATLQSLCQRNRQVGPKLIFKQPF